MTSPPSRRERKKDRTRQALLDVAIKLFAERGIHATRVEDITDRSDLGKGAFYNYFESKDQLIGELVGQGVEILRRDYLAPASALATQEERIAAVIAAHDAFFAAHPAFVVLFHQARGVASGQGALATVFVEYLLRMGEVLVATDRREQMGNDDLIDVAAMVVGAIAGYRSFRVAAGLAPGTTTVASVLVPGVAALLSARCRQSQ